MLSTPRFRASMWCYLPLLLGSAFFFHALAATVCSAQVDFFVEAHIEPEGLPDLSHRRGSFGSSVAVDGNVAALAVPSVSGSTPQIWIYRLQGRAWIRPTGESKIEAKPMFSGWTGTFGSKSSGCLAPGPDPTKFLVLTPL